MEFTQEAEPNIKKPIIIAAMQDMGNVGSIVVNFINDSLQTKTFRINQPATQNYCLISMTAANGEYLIWIVNMKYHSVKNISR